MLPHNQATNTNSNALPNNTEAQHDFRTSLGIEENLKRENSEYEITQFNPAIFDQHKIENSSSYHSRGLHSQTSQNGALNAMVNIDVADVHRKNSANKGGGSMDYAGSQSQQKLAAYQSINQI